jgi:hypothetical protein
MMRAILRLSFLGFFIVFLLISCYEFESVNQPDLADQNSTFEVLITVLLDENGNGGG